MIKRGKRDEMIMNWQKRCDDFIVSRFVGGASNNISAKTVMDYFTVKFFLS